MNNTDAFLQSVKNFKNIMIIISGSPDPDALASAYALKIILTSQMISSDIFITKKISLPQNKAFVKYLNIPLVFRKKLTHHKYDAYIVPDFQTNIVDGITNHIPCAAHIDHHTETDNKVFSGFSLIRTDAGSTSSLIALMIKEASFNLKPEEMTSSSTALMFGIQTDTDKYEHATPVDMEALNFLSGYSDRQIINRISGIPISPITMHYYKKAVAGKHGYKDWNMYGIGYIDIEHRDSIAITADLILKNPGNSVVIVYAIVEDRSRSDFFLDVSIRSRSETLDINDLIKKITPNGGGRKYKGAYQISLGYFSVCPDREMLWQLVETSTFEWLKRSRDGIYITGIENIYTSMLKRVTSIFRK